MKFFEALYGSQYYELKKKGKDSSKGRFAGNMFLAAFVIVFLFVVLLALIKYAPGFERSLNRSFRSWFGRSGGRSAGRLFAIPLLALIYGIIYFTIGTKKNYDRYTDAFMQQPDEIKNKANRKILVPFFILLGLMLFLSFSMLR